MALNCMPVFGPRAFTKFDLMGIRFAVDPEAGTGAGAGDDKGKGGFTPPESQDALNALIEGRLAREREKFKDYDALKSAADELAKLKQAKPSGEQSAEELAEAAREEGRAEMRKVLAEERVNNALTAALTGRAVNPNVLLMGFDKSQFVKGDGADTDAIKAWVEANSTETKQGGNPIPGAGQRDSTANGGSVQAGRDLYDNEKKPKRKD